jgi:hypothetical protein
MRAEAAQGNPRDARQRRHRLRLFPLAYENGLNQLGRNEVRLAHECADGGGAAQAARPLRQIEAGGTDFDGLGHGESSFCQNQPPSESQKNHPKNLLCRRCFYFLIPHS